VKQTTDKSCYSNTDEASHTVSTVNVFHIGYAKVCAREVPHTLIMLQKIKSKTVCKEYFNCYNKQGENFPQQIIITDESRLYKHKQGRKSYLVE
jgi:hypothetical protein